jgi:hypothetical protein
MRWDSTGAGAHSDIPEANSHTIVDAGQLQGSRASGHGGPSGSGQQNPEVWVAGRGFKGTWPQVLRPRPQAYSC